MENSQVNTVVEVNLDEVANLVNSEKFSRFLLTETTDFASAAYILQTLLDKIDEDRLQVDFK